MRSGCGSWLPGLGDGALVLDLQEVQVRLQLSKDGGPLHVLGLAASLFAFRVHHLRTHTQ